MFRQNFCIIRQLAEMIGNLVAAEPGVPFAQLFIKPLEIEKDQKLKTFVGSFEAEITLLDSAKSDLRWWIVNLPSNEKFCVRVSLCFICILTAPLQVAVEFLGEQ